MGSLRATVTGLALASVMAVAGCQGGVDGVFGAKANRPIPAHLKKEMKAKGMTEASPIMVRLFKEENVAEVWKQTDKGEYAMLAEYEICAWSGKLGPKYKEGDKQAPEGFYSIKPWQMNPNSDYYLSFNLGYPNAYDQSHNRTGSHLMVHGACSSAGCYSMTDERIAEIYAQAREAFEGGQTEFQVQAYPFRMTAENMARHKDDPHFGFWKMIKQGYDHFEITKRPPKVDVCEKRYVFNQVAEDEKAKFRPSGACPDAAMPESLAMAYSRKVTEDEEIFRQVLNKQEVKAKWRGDPQDLVAAKASLAPEEEPAEEAATE